MNEFRMDNTEGYNKGQLDEMNRRLVEAMECQDEDDRNYSDNLKHAGERIQKEYDNELAVEKYSSITRESTWDYDTYDENDILDGGTETIETIETWEWSDELDRYELVDLREKETGGYIPYNEEDYIRDGAVEIPTGENCRTASIVVPDWRDYLTLELTDDQEISLKIDWIDKSGNLILIDTAGVDYRKQFWTQWQGVFDESILD